MVGVNTQRAEGKETIYRPCFIYITHTFHAWWMIPNHLSFLCFCFFLPCFTIIIIITSTMLQMSRS